MLFILQKCYGLNAPSNTYVEILAPKIEVWGGRILRKWLVMRAEPL